MPSVSWRARAWRLEGSNCVMHDGTLRRILYVEDDADIRKIVSMSLEMVGDYAVVACGSCADALEVVDEFDPDLLLLDVMMPDVDGPATLRALRKRLAEEGLKTGSDEFEAAFDAEMAEQEKRVSGRRSARAWRVPTSRWS